MFIELNKQAAQQIQKNIASLASSEAKVQVVAQDCMLFLQQPANVATGFDIVFVDPPFRQGLAEKVCQQLAVAGLNKQALIYVETESECQLQGIPKNWQLLKEKRIHGNGQCFLLSI